MLGQAGIQLRGQSGAPQVTVLLGRRSEPDTADAAR